MPMTFAGCPLDRSWPSTLTKAIWQLPKDFGLYIIVESHSNEELDISLVNWSELYGETPFIQIELAVQSVINTPGVHLSGAKEYFFSFGEDVTFRLSFSESQGWAQSDGKIYGSYLQIFLGDDVSINSPNSFTVPPLKESMSLRKTLLHYIYSPEFKTLTIGSFYDYDPFYPGIFVDNDNELAIIFLSPVLSKAYIKPNTRGFSTTNFECPPTDFFSAFFSRAGCPSHQTN